MKYYMISEELAQMSPQLHSKANIAVGREGFAVLFAIKNVKWDKMTIVFRGSPLKNSDVRKFWSFHFILSFTQT